VDESGQGEGVSAYVDVHYVILSADFTNWRDCTNCFAV